jgi:hypothetical protein
VDNKAREDGLDFRNAGAGCEVEDFAGGGGSNIPESPVCAFLHTRRILASDEGGRRAQVQSEER